MEADVLLANAGGDSSPAYGSIYDAPSRSSLRQAINAQRCRLQDEDRVGPPAVQYEVLAVMPKIPRRNDEDDGDFKPTEGWPYTDDIERRSTDHVCASPEDFSKLEEDGSEVGLRNDLHP